jgi:tetratricopeptide (TPR) repeat protein
MKTLPLLLLCAGVAVGTSLLLDLRHDSHAEAAAPASAPPPAGSEAQLRLELERLRREVTELRATAPAPGGAERVPVEAIEAAVRRVLEERLAAGEVAPGEAAPDATVEPPQAEALVARLLEPGLDDAGREALWQQLREAGLLDEAVALLEARAEERPGDPEAQVDLAQACLQKVFEVGDGPAAGLWAGRADAAYDRALEADPRHWEARYGKAVSLSFWPPIFGKQREAIGHFETLVEQQRGLAPEPRHASTYLLLGNLHSQAGDDERAAAVWAEGLALFPDDEALAEKVGGQ